MTDSGARADAASNSRLAWIIGGVLLIAATLFDLVFQPVSWMIPGGEFIGAALYTASLLIFAFGIRGSGSVTARQPLGTTALAFLAVWTLISHTFWNIVPAGDIDLGVHVVLGYVGPLVEGAVALVAVVQIARAGVVPAPWNWAPTWALVAVATPWVLQLILAAGPGGPAAVAPALFVSLVTIDTFVRIGAAIFLGILAIVLAKGSTRTRTVAIFPDR